MTEFVCGNCREVHLLSSKARFCPNCGSNSLNLVIKELTEPAQKETLGVYTAPNMNTFTLPVEPRLDLKMEVTDADPKRRKASKETPHRHEVLDL